MKRAVIMIFAMCIMGMVSAQQAVEKTLIKPVNLKGNVNIELALNGKIDVKKWRNEYAQVEIGIKAYGINSTVLKSLVAAGRYNIEIDYVDEKVVLRTPALAKEINVRGKVLKDEVLFTIYVPEVSFIETGGDDLGSADANSKTIN